MKRTLTLIAVATLLLCSCKGEKRIATYEDLYKEQPFVIMLAPTRFSRRSAHSNASTVFSKVGASVLVAMVSMVCSASSMAARMADS